MVHKTDQKSDGVTLAPQSCSAWSQITSPGSDKGCSWHSLLSNLHCGGPSSFPTLAFSLFFFFLNTAQECALGSEISAARLASALLQAKRRPGERTGGWRRDARHYTSLSLHCGSSHYITHTSTHTQLQEGKDGRITSQWNRLCAAFFFSPPSLRI